MIPPRNEMAWMCDDSFGIIYMCIHIVLWYSQLQDKMLSHPVISKLFYKMANTSTNVPDLYICKICKKHEDEKCILFCNNCHKSFCYKCGSKHVREFGHELAGLCGAHQNIMDRFCEHCKLVICRVCEVRRHFDGEHHVIAYGDAIAKSKEDLGENMEVADTIFMALLEQICKVSELKARAKKEKGRMLVVVSEVLRELNFAMCDFEIRNIKDTIRYHQNQIEIMTLELKAVEARKLKGERVKRMRERLEKDSNDNLARFDSVLVEMKSLEAQMRNLLLARVPILPERLLTPKLLDDITETKKELQELTLEADRDRLTPLKSTTNFLNEDYIRSGRFFRASLQCHLKLPCDDFVAWSFASLTHNRIAASGKGEGVHTVWLWNSPSTNPSVLLTDTACMPHLAKSGEQELVILRKAHPILRVINVVTKAARDIEVEISLEAEKCWLVASDSRGHFFVTYGSNCECHILMIDYAGTVLHDLEVDYGERLTFCGLRNSLVTCSSHADVISMFRVKGNLPRGDGAKEVNKNCKRQDLVSDEHARKVRTIKESRPGNSNASSKCILPAFKGDNEEESRLGIGKREILDNQAPAGDGDNNTKTRSAETMSSQEQLNRMVRHGDEKSFFEWVKTSSSKADIKEVRSKSTKEGSLSSQTPDVLPLNSACSKLKSDERIGKEITSQGSDFCCVAEELAKYAIDKSLSGQKSEVSAFSKAFHPEVRTKSELCRTETESDGADDITSGARKCNDLDQYGSTGTHTTIHQSPGRSNGRDEPSHDIAISEVKSAAHGVEGFSCLDICSGSFGEIFVAGLMEGVDPQEVRVYQVEFDLDGKVRMTRIETPGVRMSGGYPSCAVQDNRLVLSDRYTVRVFTLKQ